MKQSSSFFIVLLLFAGTMQAMGFERDSGSPQRSPQQRRKCDADLAGQERYAAGSAANFRDDNQGEFDSQDEDELCPISASVAGGIFAASCAYYALLQWCALDYDGAQ